jgi:enoyl-CoA hydratase/carnithine racemase
MFSLKSL